MKSYSSKELHQMIVPDLKLLMHHNIRNYSKMRKQQLVDSIIQHQINNTSNRKSNKRSRKAPGISQSIIISGSRKRIPRAVVDI